MYPIKNKRKKNFKRARNRKKNEKVNIFSMYNFIITIIIKLHLHIENK